MVKKVVWTDVPSMAIMKYYFCRLSAVLSPLLLDVKLRKGCHIQLLSSLLLSDCWQLSQTQENYKGLENLLEKLTWYPGGSITIATIVNFVMVIASVWVYDWFPICKLVMHIFHAK